MYSIFHCVELIIECLYMLVTRNKTFMSSPAEGRSEPYRLKEIFFFFFVFLESLTMRSPLNI